MKMYRDSWLIRGFRSSILIISKISHDKPDLNLIFFSYTINYRLHDRNKTWHIFIEIVLATENFRI